MRSDTERPAINWALRRVFRLLFEQVTQEIPNSVPLWRRVLPFLAAVLIALTLLPTADVPLSNKVDLSYSAILNYAHAQGLQFGQDLVCTYGPAGFLIFPCFSTHTGTARLVLDFILSFHVCLGLCLVAWRVAPFWRWFLLLTFVWSATNINPRVDVLIDVGIFCWGLLCFIESGARLPLFATAFVALAAFGALAKVSFLLIAALSVLIIFSDLLLRRRPRLAMGILGGFLASFLFGWLLLGQQLYSLPGFLTNAVIIAQSYNQALGLEGLPSFRNAASCLLVLLFITAFCGIPSAFAQSSAHSRPLLRTRRFLLLAWAAFLLLANWKHGFIRFDQGHAVSALSFAPVAALTLGILLPTARLLRLYAQMLALVCTVLAILLLQVGFFPASSLIQPIRSLAYNLSCVLNPRAYSRIMVEALDSLNTQAQLPSFRKLIGNASVDVFGQFQTDALANDLNYTPRPVAQSYSACNRQLMRLNEKFYLSDRAPRFVLFDLKPMDDKLPPLEDAWALRAVLVNYFPIAVEGRYLLLKSLRRNSPRMRLVRAEIVHPSQPIDLRTLGKSAIWMEIDLKPTVAGRLRQFFYQPSTIRLAAWTTPNQHLLIRRRAPASMLASGLLVSPLILNTTDLLRLAQSEPIERPGAYSVELVKGEECFWQTQINVRIYELSNPLLDATLDYARFSFFRWQPWRSTTIVPGSWEEEAEFVAFLLFLCFCAALPLGFFYRFRKPSTPSRWQRILLGNYLILQFLLGLLLFTGEVWFRFFYDTTDSLGYTRVCQRWFYRHWRTNNVGCRDDIDYSAKAPGDKRRVTFLGDSFTAGHGIKDIQKRFPDLLRRSHPNWDVQVVANIGLDTGGELALLKKAFSEGYSVNDVVLVYCLNDVGDLLMAPGQEFANSFVGLESAPAVISHSYMLDLFYKRHRAIQTPYVKNYFSFVKSGYTGRLWERQKERLEAVRDLVQSHGGRLYVVTFPFLNALGPTYDYRHAHAELAQLWQRLKVPHLDLLSIYEGRSPKELTINRYDAHPNELANQLAAEEVDLFLALDPR